MIKPAIDHESITAKTRELCQVLLNQPAFLEMRDDIDAFLDSDSAREHYRDVARAGQDLEVRQLKGESIPEAEINAYEKLRYDFLENPVARRFIDAQQTMNGVQDTINKFISKSLELGRVANEEDIACEEGGCGSGCGCSH